MPLLSIIVPIYKAELYIEECINSLLNQSFQDYELILVDDGSPDSCPEICDHYAEKDSRVHVIHKPNGGVVSARKTGFGRATGEFISFIDADDWIDSNTYQVLFDQYLSDDPDIIVYGYKEERENGTVSKGHSLPSGFYEGESLQALQSKALHAGPFYTPGIVPALWTKLIKRSLLYQVLPDVNEMIMMGDDAAVTYPVLLLAQRVVIDNEFRPYHYREVYGSLSRTFQKTYFVRISCLIRWLRFFLEEHNGANMLVGLDYYTLFLYYIGINSFVTSKKASELLSSTVRDELEGIVHKIDLRAVIERVDSDAFPYNLWKRFSMLTKGNISRYLTYELLCRGIRKIERMQHQ